MKVRGFVIARLPITLVALSLCIGFAPRSEAYIDVMLDDETISELLVTMMPEQILVPLPTGRKIPVEISDLKVTGFDPTAGEDRKGYVLTFLRLRSPSLGLVLAVEPRVSLSVADEDGRRQCVLRFEEVELDIPMAGAVDISPLLPPISVPADYVSVLRAGRGNMQVRSRLVDVRMGMEKLRLRFDVTVEPAAEDKAE